MKAPNRHSLSRGPVISGIAAALATAVVLVAAQVGSADEGVPLVRAIPAFALLNGTLVALFFSRRLWALLAGVAAGIVTGVASTWGLIGQPVDGLFVVVTLTLAFFTFLGLAAGAFLEFVFFLHHVSHGRKPTAYPHPPRTRAS